MFKENLFKRIGLQFFAEDSGAGSGGTSGSDGGSGTDPAGANGGTSAPAGGRTFTQEDVNSMMANEKRSARTALLKELGYEVKDGKYTEVISTIKGILDQGKTQQQLDNEARAKAEGDKTVAEAKAASLQAQVDVMKAGVKPDYVDDAIAMLLPKVTDEKPLSKLLEDYKAKYPAWFGEAGSSGTGSATNPPSKGTNQDGAMGKRLAQSINGSVKSSYFKN